jgi:hypothetical protein
MSLLMVLLTFLSEAYVLWWMGDAPLVPSGCQEFFEWAEFVTIWIYGVVL